MIYFKKIFLSITLLVFVGHAFAMVDKEKQQITSRHFTIAPPFSIKSVEAYTNIPNFSVVKTSDYTFDVFFDYIYPAPRSYASVKLWVMSENDKSYAEFVSNEIGIQFIQCIRCPHINKIDSNNYQFIFE
ncbi:hypothetical protein J2N86_05985 [Legionella lytica]|uniref:Uncharacterized protein n=1 Tax=Legionella lytica TaxID=96232 RepID=A0ABY4YCP6_9GAMM|nr:hypothetical protein [Legionella lytica]USQ14849.1 hypothetical protein J2N86_05985 [Legionella lytica]